VSSSGFNDQVVYVVHPEGDSTNSSNVSKMRALLTSSRSEAVSDGPIAERPPNAMWSSGSPIKPHANAVDN
jgi:hypothetical protein